MRKNMFKLLMIVWVVFVFLAVNQASAQTFIQGPALIEGTTTTATSGGTTVLTKNSQTNQIFTGTLGHTVQLPDATTIPIGRRFYIHDTSTGSMAVTRGGGGGLTSVLAGNSVAVRLTAQGSANGTWDVENDYTNVPATVLVGVVPLINGGTNLANVANAGGVAFSTASTISLGPVGASGQLLQSNAAGSPTWTTNAFPSTATAPCSLLTNTTNAITCLAATTPNRLLRTNGTTLSFAQVDLTTDVTGVLALANGGTNNNNVAALGASAYSTASGISFTAVGISGQYLKSNGAGAPTWVVAGDVSGPSASIDSEVALFSGTTGKLLKRAAGTGFVKNTAGVYSTSTTVSLATDVNGLLPLANGGLNNNNVAALGSVPYSTASAISLTAVGVSGQLLTSQGSAAPVWTTTAAAVSMYFARIAGTAYQPGASGCGYNESTSSGESNYITMATAGGCSSAWLVSGDITMAAGPTSTVVTYTNMPPGSYEISVNGQTYVNGATGLCNWQIFDGTDSLGYGSNQGTNGTGGSPITGTITYASTATRTYVIQASDNFVGSCNLDNGAIGRRIFWTFKRFWVQ